MARTRRPDAPWRQASRERIAAEKREARQAPEREHQHWPEDDVYGITRCGTCRRRWDGD